MTDAIHAVDAAQIGEPGCATNTYLMRSILPFVRDPFGQYVEARGDKAGAGDPLAGSPAFNFLTGSGGFSQVFAFGLTGLRWREERVHVDPMLPPQLAQGVTLQGLQWRGRTFTIDIGPQRTTLTLQSGDAFTVESPAGTSVLRGGSPVTVATRRPDLEPTDDVARCKPATATSEETGLYAEAAVDGSDATVWAPTAATASLTVDLGARTQVGDVVPTWTDNPPASSRIFTSTDGTHWTAWPQHPTWARYVRVDITRSGTERAGIAELRVLAQ
jgi:hypothetical protein